MITVTLNNKQKELKEGTTVRTLLTEIDNERAAVWINGRQLFKCEYESRKIRSGDHIKILRIIGGG